MEVLSKKHYAIILFVILTGILSVQVQAQDAQSNEDAKAAMAADKTGDIWSTSLSKLIWARQPEQTSWPTLASQSYFLASVDVPDGSQSAEAQDAPELASKSDKSGTNPVNFTYDLRFYNEYQWLKNSDGHQNVSTLEYRMPLMDGKWQFRFRTRATSFSADLNGDGSTDVDEGGRGDTDFRFLTVPIMDAPNKFAFAYGFETFLDTASHDSLGSGSTSLGPQVYLAFFKPFGGFFDMIVPGYIHKFSVHEEKGRSDVEQGLIDVFFLKMSKDKQSWMMINPTFILDYENNNELAVIDFEFGTMINKLLSSEAYKGHSAYIRPGIGIGGDRSMDASIEVGYKIVW